MEIQREAPIVDTEDGGREQRWPLPAEAVNGRLDLEALRRLRNGVI